MAEALGGIRVFDASAGVAGPYASHLLSLAGADVWKIEPHAGEWGRAIGRRVGGVGLPFLSFNRGKRSLSLDLKTVEGQALAREVALQCDVIVESFRPGVMERLGLGPERLMSAKPQLIYLSISGFGSRGPNADRPALDTVIQAQSGWLDLLRDYDGRPVLMDYVPIDVLTGLYAAQAMMAALISRFRFGTGRRLEMSLLEAATAFLAPKFLEAVLMDSRGAPAAGVPTGIYPAADGLVAIATRDDAAFRQLVQALGNPSLADDPRFATRTLRDANRADCEMAITNALSMKSAGDWDVVLGRAGVVAGKVLSVRELLLDPQFKALNVIVDAEQPGLGTAPHIAVPGLDNATLRPAPAIGEHSREILAIAGIDEARIEQSVRSGVVSETRWG